MHRFVRLYKQKLHFIKWYILERTLYPKLKVIRGIIAVILALVIMVEIEPLIKDYVTKLGVLK